MSVVDLFFFVAEHDDHHLATITRLMENHGHMEELRYPIGRLELKRRLLTDEERAQMIDTIEAHPANMRAAVAGLADAQLDTQYRDGGWTVRQVVHHVVDSHINSYVRFKLAVTEDKPTIGTYEEAEWAELPEARSAPVEMSLAILDALHLRWVSMLRAFDGDQFARTLHYPGQGEIAVDVLLEIYDWHCRHHEAHVTALRSRRGW